MKIIDDLSNSSGLVKGLALILIPILFAVASYFVSSLLLDLLGDVSIPGVVAGWVYGLVFIFLLDNIRS